MHNIKFIRNNPEEFDKGLKRRGAEPMSKIILTQDQNRRIKILESEKALAAKNEISKKVGLAKQNNEQREFEILKDLVSKKKIEVTQLNQDAKTADKELQSLLLEVPNLPLSCIPDGKDELNNKEVYKWGVPKKFSFSPKEHFEIDGSVGMDFKSAAKISGSRFVILSGAMARLHRALAEFMIDTHVKSHSLLEVWAPVLVKQQAMIGTGQLPKFSEDSYETTNKSWLIPTAEVTLTNLAADKTFDIIKLPQRLTCHSQCFRSEAGSAGKDTSGMLRQHQFEKVEMVTFSTPENGLSELERMRGCAQNILELLELPYRTMLLCAGDLGFSSKITYDLEVWLPGQNKYREISSCSLCGDFQARRMNARYKKADGQKPEFIHTLNGSGLAVGRCLIAVLENYQNSDGSITIPSVLTNYMSGFNLIDAKGKLQ